MDPLPSYLIFSMQPSYNIAANVTCSRWTSALFKQMTAKVPKQAGHNDAVKCCAAGGLGMKG